MMNDLISFSLFCDSLKVLEAEPKFIFSPLPYQIITIGQNQER